MESWSSPSPIALILGLCLLSSLALRRGCASGSRNAFGAGDQRAEMDHVGEGPLSTDASSVLLYVWLTAFHAEGSLATGRFPFFPPRHS